ncbi:MAG: helix-turn-helix domain-containing protein [Ktedonobacteraceae bacterium]
MLIKNCSETQDLARNRVKDVAEPKGYTMTSLARETGISFNTIKRLWKNPSLGANVDTLTRIAKVLRVGIGELIEDTDD